MVTKITTEDAQMLVAKFKELDAATGLSAVIISYELNELQWSSNEIVNFMQIYEACKGEQG